MNPLETYLKELSEIRSSGALVKEISYYSPLANLLNEIGKSLKSEVKYINQPAEPRRQDTRRRAVNP
jgi:hypothetical protein